MEAAKLEQDVLGPIDAVIEHETIAAIDQAVTRLTARWLPAAPSALERD